MTRFTLPNILRASVATRSTARRPGVASKLSVEALEAREVLAASASLSSTGVLLIEGTKNADTIKVSQSGTNIWVSIEESDGLIGSYSAQSFPAAKVSLVRVLGYGGHDSITTYGIKPNASLWGGEGNDSLYGGLGNDSLYGDTGNDLLYGNEGNDELNGWTGNDTLYGYTGNDKLYGGEDNDYLNGNADKDELYGWTGKDTLIGSAGLDKLDGGVGDDRLEVYVNLDDLLANKGRTINFSDTFKVGNGTDTVVASLDLDSFGRRFLKPVVDEVSRATYSLQPVLDLLDRKIPFLSQLDSGLTFGGLLSRTNATVAKFINTMKTIRDFQNTVGAWSGTVNLGTFTVASGSMDIRTVTSNAIGGITSSLLTKLRDIGFSFTLLEDPRSAVRMMLGLGATLFELQLPTLDISFNYSKSWDIPTGVAAVNIQTSLGGSLRLKAGATIGLDTLGIWSGNIMDGFYIRNAYASLTAGLSASGGVGVGIPNVWSAVSVGIQGGISGTVTFSLNDPNKDGLLRWNELPQYYSNSLVTTGQLNYGVSGFVKYWHVTKFKNVKETWSFYTGTLTL